MKFFEVCTECSVASIVTEAKESSIQSAIDQFKTIIDKTSLSKNIKYSRGQVDFKKNHKDFAEGKCAGYLIGIIDEYERIGEVSDKAGASKYLKAWESVINSFNKSSKEYKINFSKENINSEDEYVFVWLTDKDNASKVKTSDMEKYL